MKKIFFLAFLTIVSDAFSQDWPVKKLVTDKKAAGVVFKNIPAFTFKANKELAGKGTYQELQLEAAFTRQLMAQRPAALSLRIPLSATETLTCELVKASLGNVKITENNGQVIPKIQIPVLYRGIIIGEQQKNTAILTVNSDYVSLIITSGSRAIQMAQADSANPLSYRLYDSRQVQFPQQPVHCGTADLPTLQTPDGVLLDGTLNRNNAPQDKCVNVFVDCTFLLYQFLGSNRQRTTNYVYELFHLVTTGYINESVNIQVGTINIWTAADPFRRDNVERVVKDIGVFYKDNFWGNILVSLDYSTRLGGIGWIGKVKAVTINACASFNAADSMGPFAYNDLNFGGNFNNTFPTGPHVTGPQVALVMHELGHKLGSRHTHWCGWKLDANTNTNTIGAIDSCVSVENPPCAVVGTTPPPGGGTIMSYCHLNAASFTNYNNGFGPLPGNAIRDFVSNTTCIPVCQACPEEENFGLKKQDNKLMFPAAAQVWGGQRRTLLLPNTRQHFFAATATAATVSAYTTNRFRKPKEPAMPLAAAVSVK